MILISIDLTKAFDVIRHDILLKKLEYAGIRGSISTWFKSYLNKRPQRTKANGINSDYLTVKTRVPQGSFLGPLSFLIYVNDLKNVINEENLNTLVY